MPHYPSSIELEVRMIDGTSHHFSQSEASQIEKFLTVFQPNKIFSQGTFVAETDRSVLILPTANIVSFEFVMDANPGWRLSAPEAKMRRLDKTEFQELFKTQTDPKLARGGEMKQGDTYYGFIHINLAPSKHLVLEVEAEIGTAMDQRSLVTHLFNSPAIVLGEGSGRISIINPSHVLRIDLYPGQPNIAPFAFKTEHPKLARS